MQLYASLLKYVLSLCKCTYVRDFDEEKVSDFLR